MTLEEKLEHFKELSSTNAKEESEAILNSYKKSLDEEFEAHKISAEKLALETTEARKGQVRAALKKELASNGLSIKKELTNKKASIKADVFRNVRTKLLEYKKTEDYFNYLVKEITEISTQYKNLDITVYIDSDDSCLLTKLKESTNANIEISDKSFIGGTKTIVPSLNILIDNSFKTRLADEQEQFRITL